MLLMVVFPSFKETTRYVAKCDEIVDWYDSTKDKMSADIARMRNERKEVGLCHNFKYRNYASNDDV